ncbi:MAG: hypothetical protein R6V55_03620, partial [Desulfovermiculus sp.]
AAANGRHADIDYLQERLGGNLTRKEIASYASKLYNRGYLDRVEKGKYRANEKLSQLAGGTKAEEPPAEHAEDAGKSPAVIIRKQTRDQAEQAAKKRQEADLARLGNLVDRLENLAERLDKNADLQEAMDLLEQAWAKGRKHRIK